MMNHHLPPMPHGQPMPPPRRQHEMPYSGPPNVRSPPAYMGYHHPHGSGPVPPYPGQQFQQWYSYQQQAQAHPPPRPYQQPYAPLIVSSYPHSQPVPTPANLIPPPSLPPQPSNAAALASPQPSLSPAPSNFARVNGQHPVSVPPPVNRSKNSQVSREPFHPPLPWLSVPDAPFPAKIPRRRRKPRVLESSAAAVQLPAKDNQKDAAAAEVSKTSQTPEAPEHTAAAAPSEPQTPVTSHAPSETDSTQPTTPSSATLPQIPSRAQSTQSQTKNSRAAVPIVPVVPILPQSPSTSKQASQDTARRGSMTPKSSAPPATSELGDDPQTPTAASSAPGDNSEESNKDTSAPRPAPKSWADLVRTKGSQAPGNSAANIPPVGASGLGVSKSASLVDVLSNLGTDVEEYSNKIAFVEPRGLVNTGNMCYMNSVLQILVFCVPFYEFLDRIGQQAAHSFNTDLPLIDSMIMFLREYRIIDAATSPEQLRLRLKQNELEQYGEAFTPEYVYQVIRHLPRFRDMRRGHQQDAQEFLGFLLEELHEECALAMKSTTSATSDASTPTNGELNVNDEPSLDGWLEVGHKQKANVTRSSGHVVTESPITKIFGGKIRSEFRVPGNKNSVTLEPYQPLQLDIGSPQVNNIIDALKGLTRPETMQGDFNSSRGPKVTATKQVFIETLPPVLILHLKRFHYDSATRGTQKIWKKIGYPLELEIPKEVFSPHRRAALSVPGGLPKYRLIGVIYHHGKNASGGHYTVDVRRQDGREWIRLDDTVIRRVKSEDVANAGSEEDPKVLAAALERHKGNDKTPQGNIFEQFDQEEQDQRENERGWSQVNGAGANGHSSKKSISAAAANGTASPAVSGVSSGKGTPSGRYAARDNKVAYLLFYQRINTP